MNKGTKLKKLRKSGFRIRMQTVSGRRIIKSRRNKKRHTINI